jgi:dTDP-4-amino-4,6-dideoxygalactose transaminase
MNVPFVDLKAQYASIKGEVLDAIAQVLDGMQLNLGPNVQAFEKEFAAYTGVKHAIGVGSGTDALHALMLACDIGPGDEVITVAHTFVATSEAVLAVGAVPVFVDVEPGTQTMDPALI